MDVVRVSGRTSVRRFEAFAVRVCPEAPDKQPKPLRGSEDHSGGPGQRQRILLLLVAVNVANEEVDEPFGLHS